MIITDQKELVGKWVSSLLGKPDLYSYQSIGLARNGELVAGVIVDNYVKNGRCSILCVGLGKYWLNREFLFVVFDYVFRQLGCKVVVNQVDADNEASIRFTKHIGFTEALRIKDGSGDCDLLIFTMRKEQCKWLERDKDGKKIK